jgi:cytochrome c
LTGVLRAGALALALSAALSPATAQDLIGHGGPVGALALAGGVTVSGAFDTRAILWDDQGTAQAVLRVHDGAVTAVALLPGGQVASGGQDGRVAIWGADRVLPQHLSAPGRAPVVALSVGPLGLAVAHRDGQVVLLDFAGAQTVAFAAHRDRITGLGHLPDGSLVTVGADLSFSRWQGDRLVARADLPGLPNGLAVLGDRVAIAYADGALRLHDAQGTLLPERFLTDRPLVAVAAGGGQVAAAAVDGTVWLLDGTDFEPRHRLLPGQGPVWALALDGRHLLTGGADGRVLRWSVDTGARLGQGEATDSTAHDDGSRGAEVWRACAVCHTLTPDDGNRAGPTLHRIFGRRIGTAPGYDYSDALPRLDITWTPETVAALFEFGPEAYTPGSRMPEQRLSDPADRQALVEFLARHSD